jgi:hypothetical protein
MMPEKQKQECKNQQNLMDLLGEVGLVCRIVFIYLFIYCLIFNFLSVSAGGAGVQNLARAARGDGVVCEQVLAGFSRPMPQRRHSRTPLC